MERFPKDFMFRLTKEECKDLQSQNATASWGGRRREPFVFMEHGVLVLSSVLNSDRAIVVNIQIIQVFTKIREILSDIMNIKMEIEEIKKKLSNQNRNIELVFSYLDELLEKKDSPDQRPKIGYKKS